MTLSYQVCIMRVINRHPEFVFLKKQNSDQNAPLTQDKDLIESSIHVSNKQDLSTKTLILEQQKDSTLLSLFQNTVSEDEISSVPCCYYKKNGVLMRKWRPPDVPSDAE